MSGEAQLIYVCRTCARAAHPGSSEAGAGLRLAEQISAALAAGGGELDVREVACLNGCLQPCNVALRGSGRNTLRFSHVVEADVPSLIVFSRQYWASAPGQDVSESIPPQLRVKLTVDTAPLAH